ncbi:MAG: metallophosphoesterase [Bacillota bacterium]|jgi:predicted phosphohydrolase
MKVFAISDLHLSLGAPFVKGCENQLLKPMDKFGEFWNDYHEKIYENWQALVGEHDYVLMPGDTSWAMKLADCRYDFDFLAQLPGTIILGRGNHDYWWQGISKLRAALPPNVIPLHHDSVIVGSKSVCSTRGWSLPFGDDWTAADQRIYQRELLRLEMALEDGKKSALPLVVMLHYMPFFYDGSASQFVELMKKYQVEICLYGHLHGSNCHKAVHGLKDGINYFNVSCDCLSFCPQLIWEE